MNTSNDPLHGKKLADILDELLDYYGGFEGLDIKQHEITEKSLRVLNSSINASRILFGYP